MTKHTPGPWKTDPFGYITGGESFCMSIVNTFVFVWESAMKRLHAEKELDAAVHMADAFDEAQANARLIAAAPDLLEALYEILHYGQAGIAHDLVRVKGYKYLQSCACEYIEDVCGYCKARAAIAEAEGRKP